MTDLTTLKRWLVFRLTPQPNGTVDKFPMCPVPGRGKGPDNAASSSDPSTWATYEEARAFVVAHESYTLGFALGKEVGLAIIDVDKARESKTAPWPEWVEELVDEVNSFNEDSISGRGKHIYVWGSVPTNQNRQKCHVELWDSNKMFAVSQAFAENWHNIRNYDLTELHRRISEGKIGPDHKKQLVIYSYNDTKFKKLMSDAYEGYFSSRSEAVASALSTLAVKHNCNREAMRAEFEASELCQNWNGKWARLGDREIERAIKFTEEKRKSQPIGELPAFKHPEVGGEREYVLRPREKFDGWFPTSSVSVIGGPSGAGKTTMLLQMLDAVSRGEEILGHPTKPMSYKIIFADRQESDNNETLERMQLEHMAAHTECLPLCWDNEAVLRIKDIIEATPNTPRVVVVEGGDMLPSEARDLKIVSTMIKRFQEIASHYNLAIILSVGSPKAAVGEGYALMRDRIYGSQIFGRMASTIVTMSYPKGADGTEKTRVLDVLHRNAGNEHYMFTFVNGRLAQSVEDVNSDPVITWLKQKDSFNFKETIGHFANAGIGKAQVRNRIMKLLERGEIKLGADNQYTWKSEETNSS